jgi:hypothetical protein
MPHGISHAAAPSRNLSRFPFLDTEVTQVRIVIRGFAIIKGPQCSTQPPMWPPSTGSRCIEHAGRMQVHGTAYRYREYIADKAPHTDLATTASRGHRLEDNLNTILRKFDIFAIAHLSKTESNSSSKFAEVSLFPA